ncbi:MAG: hypothetical protein Q4G35_12515 [Propionibacteriaceae bacterium]|nr:hypothetical protein [Propionibacteriaceae bacterium]
MEPNPLASGADLSDIVLNTIRTRRDLHRWRDSNQHGEDMHSAIDVLEAHRTGTDPKMFFQITQKALMSSLRVIMRADDSSGIIGSAVDRLLELHPSAALAAQTPPSKLVEWMINFQFHSEADFFTLDIVEYAPALGEKGLELYRRRLADIRASLGPKPSEDERWRSSHTHEWFTLEHNDRRLAVLDRNIAEIIRTHARDQRVAAWLTDTSKAFLEIGETELAIEWAKRATDHDRGHQSRSAAANWLTLLAEHQPEQLLEATHYVFLRWPSSFYAVQLRDRAGSRWPEFREEVETHLKTQPDEAVRFAIADGDPSRALELAHELGPIDTMTVQELAKALDKDDPVAALDLHTELVNGMLIEANANNYRAAAVRLKHMTKVAQGTGLEQHVEELITFLREEHRRRPRLQQEFDKAGLP